MKNTIYKTWKKEIIDEPAQKSLSIIALQELLISKDVTISEFVEHFLNIGIVPRIIFDDIKHHEQLNEHNQFNMLHVDYDFNADKKIFDSFDKAQKTTVKTVNKKIKK